MSTSGHLRWAVCFFSATVVIGLLSHARAVVAAPPPQQIQITGAKIDGKITGMAKGMLEIAANNTKWAVNMEGKLGPMVQLGTPPIIAVRGSGSPKLLAPGQSIRFNAEVDKRNHIHGEVFAVDIFVADKETLYGVFPTDAVPAGGPNLNEPKADPKVPAKPGPKTEFNLDIKPETKPEAKPAPGTKTPPPPVETRPAGIVARVASLKGDMLSIQIPNGSDRVKLAETCLVNFETNDYSFCKIGDPVTGTIGYIQPPNAVAVNLVINVTMEQDQEKNKRNKNASALKPVSPEKPTKLAPDKKPADDKKPAASNPNAPEAAALKLEKQGDKDKPADPKKPADEK